MSGGPPEQRLHSLIIRIRITTVLCLAGLAALLAVMVDDIAEGNTDDAIGWGILLVLLGIPGLFARIYVLRYLHQVRAQLEARAHHNSSG